MIFIFFSCLQPPVPDELRILKEIEENPEKASSLCAQIQDHDTKERCTSITLRPHLWDNPKPIERQKSTRVNGPAGKHLLPSISLETPSYLPPQAQDQCTQNMCWEKRAEEAKSIEETSVLCQHIEKKLWRQECFFLSAEQHLEEMGYSHSASLCIASGDLAANCFLHLSNNLAEKAPPALSELEYEWVQTVQFSTDIHTFWLERDVQFGDAMVAQFWAKALDVSYTKAGIVAGNPIDFTPKEARPHVHAAASLHLMLMEGAQSYSLEEWAHRTQRALDARLPSKATRPQRSYQRRKASSPWPSDAPNETHLPATMYMTDGRRTYSEDTHIDLLITTLEAAARSPNGQNLVEEGKKNDHELVRWTAVRLSKK